MSELPHNQRGDLRSAFRSGQDRCIASGLSKIALCVCLCFLSHDSLPVSAQVNPLGRADASLDDFSAMESAYVIKDYDSTIASGISFLQSYSADPRAGRARLLVGKSYYALEEDAEALRYLELSARDESQETVLESLRYATEAAYRLGEFTKTVQLADQFLAIDPLHSLAAMVYCLRGNVAMNEGRYDDAITDFSRVDIDFPSSEDRDVALFGLAEIYRFQGDPIKAGEQYREIMNRPGSSMALESRYCYGAMLGETGEMEEAARVLSILLDEGPNVPRRNDACLLMGMLLFEQGYFPAAEGMFVQAAESSDPEQAAAAGFWRGIVNKEPEPAEAERIFRDTLAAYPGTSHEIELKLHLAASLLMQYKTDEAKLIIDELDQSLPEDSPVQESLLYSLAWQAQQAGDFESLESYVAQFHAEWPRSTSGPYVAKLYADSLIEQGRYLDAYETLNQLTSSVEDIDALEDGDRVYYYQDVYKELTCLLEVEGRRDLARSQFQAMEGKASAPDDIRAQAVLAWAGSLLDEGRYEEALPILEERIVEATDPRTGAVTLRPDFIGTDTSDSRSLMSGGVAPQPSVETQGYVWESIDATEAVTLYELAAFNTGSAAQAKAVFAAYQQQALDPGFPAHFINAIRDAAVRANESVWAQGLSNIPTPNNAIVPLSDPSSEGRGGLINRVAPNPSDPNGLGSTEGTTPGTTTPGTGIPGEVFQDPLNPLPLHDPNLGQGGPQDPGSIDSGTLLTNAREAFRRLDWEGVLQATEQILEAANPAIASEACYLRAEAFNAQGIGQKALFLYQKVISEHPNSIEWPDSLFRAAEYLASINQRTQALAYYKQLTEGQVVFRDMDLALDSYAWLLWDERRYDEAQTMLARINQNHPVSKHWSPATVVLVEYALCSGDYVLADLYYRDLEQHGFDSSLTDRVRRLAPNISMLRQEWPLAESQWNSLLADAVAVQDADGVLAARFGLSEVAFFSEDYESAWNQLNEILEDLDPADTNPATRRMSAKVIIRLMKIKMTEEDPPWDEIGQWVTKAKETAPSFGMIYEADWILGESLNKRKRYAEAEAAFEAVLRNPRAINSKTAAESRYGIALSRFDRDLYVSAAQAFIDTYGEQGAPSDLKANSLLGAAFCYEKTQQLDEAISLYERVAAEFPRTNHEQNARSKLAELNAQN
jgi:tetratricopeptide (TPR) repeat protein